MARTQVKAGDLVRINAKAGRFSFDHKRGQVVHVVAVTGWEETKGFIRIGSEDGHIQSIPDGTYKLAKQAMRKRAAYEAKRG